MQSFSPFLCIWTAVTPKETSKTNARKARRPGNAKYSVGKQSSKIRVRTQGRIILGYISQSGIYCIITLNSTGQSVIPCRWVPAFGGPFSCFSPHLACPSLVLVGITKQTLHPLRHAFLPDSSACIACAAVRPTLQ